MRVVSCLFVSLLAAGIALLPCPLHAQAAQLSAAPLPDAPPPQIAAEAGAPQAAPPQASSSAQAPATAADAEKSQREKAEEQLKEQEKQRVMGVMATFNTTRNMDALPLTAGQKYRLFFRSATDPWAYGLAGVVSGIGQARDDEPQWGQGAKGYFTRFGASYGDYFIGNFFGNAVLPSLLHEDPRYFQKGTGSKPSRILWAASSTVWCRRDDGRWGPNWANVAGNLIGSAISRVYYPASESTVTDTITGGLTVTAEGIVGSEVIEFWPDLVRRSRRKRAERLARREAQAKQAQATSK